MPGKTLSMKDGETSSIGLKVSLFTQLPLTTTTRNTTHQIIIDTLDDKINYSKYLETLNNEEREAELRHLGKVMSQVNDPKLRSSKVSLDEPPPPKQNFSLLTSTFINIVHSNDVEDWRRRVEGRGKLTSRVNRNHHNKHTTGSSACVSC